MGYIVSTKDFDCNQIIDFLKEGYVCTKNVVNLEGISVNSNIALVEPIVEIDNVPFENMGVYCSALMIIATGVVNSIDDKNQRYDVAWELDKNKRKWFHCLNTMNVQKELIEFVFEDKKQDIDFFEKYGKYHITSLEFPICDPFTSADYFDLHENYYDLNSIILEGCFLPKEQLEIFASNLLRKSNLILQGPPGTGKTWLAKRLAKALIGKKDVPQKQLRAIQFHPGFTYEEFVRGYRPNSDGRLSIVDGIFVEMINAAKSDPENKYFLIIEEINRGKTSQIFGEMLTLIENTKRSEQHAMELTYQRTPGETIYIPKNFYIIGTMNVSDIGTYPFDLALRRRFVFENLEPLFNSAWEEWCRAKSVDVDVIHKIKCNLIGVNKAISKDRNLGFHYQIGHSFFTPSENVSNSEKWLQEIIESEILHLLTEYWHNEPEQVSNFIDKLLK